MRCASWSGALTYCRAGGGAEGKRDEEISLAGVEHSPGKIQRLGLKNQQEALDKGA